MSQRELMRLFEEFDGEVSLSDFSPEELKELLNCKDSDLSELKRKYFEFYDDIKSSSLKKQDW